ncbi:hypothetical protein Tco_0285557 [Tanacetum coccineum]
MNMFNHNCKTGFVKPEFLKKAQRANPRLYDIGFYNDNLALMLARESDEMIRLAQESRSKLSDLIKPFDYENLNNLYDLFVSQREKSPEQRYFSERSKMSHTSAKNEKSKESFNKHSTLLERRMDESIPWDQNVYTTLDEFTDLQCDYVDQVVKCERLEKELSKHNTTSKRVIPTISVSKPQLKSKQLEDRVMHNNSQRKKQDVEDHCRSFKFSNNKTSIATCNDSLNAKTSNLVEIILFIVDSGCSKHMTGNLKLLSNFVEKFLGTVKFGNDQIAPILGYGYLVQGNITIKKVYYVEGLNHNLFSVGQFCDADLEVAFQKSTCYT